MKTRGFLSARNWLMTRRVTRSSHDAAQIRSSTFQAVFIACRFVGVLTSHCSIPSSQLCLEARAQLKQFLQYRLKRPI
jgi:hypothetical protein